MARLVVVSSADLADGFRLAGPATHVARPGAEAARVVRAVAAEGDVGVVLVTADLWASLDERLRGALERGLPIVQPIPIGMVTDATVRRRLIGDMLQRAIGYRLELSATAGDGSPAEVHGR